MSFLVNLGYQFSLPDGIIPSGSFLLASGMPMHQLARRRFNNYAHLKQKFFDPQLYFSGLNAHLSEGHCSNLASYPWFGLRGLQRFDSQEMTQAQWRSNARQNVSEIWTRNTPNDPGLIAAYVDQCIDFQISIGCEAIILPSPLTTDPGGDYSLELLWLDTAIENIRRRATIDLPVYATVAISDTCLRNNDPDNNQLLDLIIDNVSSREIDGVYLVLEQSQEPSDSRQCADARSLWSILHLTHVFSRFAKLLVAVNFIGQFGLACRAAGANVWATGWYKSLYRIRLTDSLAGGRAYPYYWSNSAAVDVHLDNELNLFSNHGMLERIQTETTASNGLLRALREGVNVSSIPAWRYAPSNISSASEHYFLACIEAERLMQIMPQKERINLASQWLASAVEITDEMRRIAGQGIRTKTNHVRAWQSAFQSYRRLHSI